PFKSTPVLSRAIESCTTPTIRNSTKTPKMDSADSVLATRANMQQQYTSIHLVMRGMAERTASSLKFWRLLSGQFQQLLDRWDSLAAPPSLPRDKGNRGAREKFPEVPEPAVGTIRAAPGSLGFPRCTSLSSSGSMPPGFRLQGF